MAATIKLSDLKQKKWDLESIVEALEECEKPLPKPHVCWTMNKNVMDSSPGDPLFELAKNYTRLTGNRMCLKLRSSEDMKRQIDSLWRFVEPESSKVFFNYSPMHKSMEGLETFGPLFHEELIEFGERLDWLRKNGPAVDSCMLDHEEYVADGQRGALSIKLGMFYSAVKERFPHADVVFYGAHSIRRVLTGDGWDEYPRFAGPTDMACVPCYNPFEPIHLIETMNRTAENLNSKGMGGMNIFTCVSLASSWLEKLNGPRVWVNGFDRPGDRINWWRIGGLMNNSWYSRPDQVGEYFDNARVKMIQFWPEPFDPQMELPWAVAFHAYYLGAFANKNVEL